MNHINSLILVYYFPKPRNPQKILPTKISCYTVFLIPFIRAVYDSSICHYVAGEFGIVYKGHLKSSFVAGNSELVAVKTLKGH